MGKNDHLYNCSTADGMWEKRGRPAKRWPVCVRGLRKTYPPLDLGSASGREGPRVTVGGDWWVSAFGIGSAADGIRPSTSNSEI